MSSSSPVANDNETAEALDELINAVDRLTIALNRRGTVSVNTVAPTAVSPTAAPPTAPPAAAPEFPRLWSGTKGTRKRDFYKGQRVGILNDVKDGVDPQGTVIRVARVFVIVQPRDGSKALRRVPENLEYYE
jgi:hypothetical protein